MILLYDYYKKILYLNKNGHRIDGFYDGYEKEKKNLKFMDNVREGALRFFIEAAVGHPKIRKNIFSPTEGFDKATERNFIDFLLFFNESEAFERFVVPDKEDIEDEEIHEMLKTKKDRREENASKEDRQSEQREEQSKEESWTEVVSKRDKKRKGKMKETTRNKSEFEIALYNRFENLKECVNESIDQDEFENNVVSVSDMSTKSYAEAAGKGKTQAEPKEFAKSFKIPIINKSGVKYTKWDIISKGLKLEDYIEKNSLYTKKRVDKKKDDNRERKEVEERAKKIPDDIPKRGSKDNRPENRKDQHGGANVGQKVRALKETSKERAQEREVKKEESKDTRKISVSDLREIIMMKKEKAGAGNKKQQQGGKEKKGGGNLKENGELEGVVEGDYF